MAVNNNENVCKDLWDVDPNEISMSAFDSIDEFKPKIYTKDVGFGKRKSFLCFSKLAKFLRFFIAISQRNLRICGFKRFVAIVQR